MSVTFSSVPRFLPARLPRVCVAIAANNPAEMVQKADVLVRENPFVEFRLDYLPKPALGLPKLRTFVEYHPETLIVATCRRAAAGGKYRGTKKLEETFARMKQYPADFFKVVSTANSLYDNVQMMKFLEKHSPESSIVGICMGEQGIMSRVLCVRAGSQFTFAAPSAGEETAPGQIAARVLRETFRIDQVDAATKVYGVAGDPVAHSLSPIMLNT